MSGSKFFTVLAVAAVGSMASIASAGTIIVDIGSTNNPGNFGPATTLDGSSSVYFNAISAGSTSTPSRNTIASLTDTTGAASGFALNVLDAANTPGIGSTRTTSTDFTGSAGASLFSAAMMQDFLAVFNSNKNFDYAISGLDPSKTYDFEILANRNGTAGTTQITLAGQTSTVSSIAASNNTALLSMHGIAPDAGGQIVMFVASPTTSSLYAPINVFQFTEVVPEPASASLLALGSLLGLRRRR